MASYGQSNSGGFVSPTLVELDSGAAAVATWDLSGAFGGMNGDRDRYYDIDIHVPIPASTGAIAYSLNVNGAGTNIHESVLYVAGAATVAVADGAFGLTNTGTTNAGYIVGVITIVMKTGRPRYVQFDGQVTDATTGAVKGSHTRASFGDTSTNITGLSIVTSSGNNISAHALATVRRPMTLV